MTETKKVYLAVFLSIVVLFVTSKLFPVEELSTEPQPEIAKVEEKPSLQPLELEEESLTTEEALAKDKRINISNSALDGSLRSRGARLDNLFLLRHRQALAKDSGNVELLIPAKTDNPYYTEFGWISQDKSIKTPNSETNWTVKGNGLTANSPVILEWNNDQGVKFTRKITVDDDYMFFVEDNIENNSGKNLSFYPYGLISRQPDDMAKIAGIVHQGLIGVLGGSLKERKYDAIKDDKKEVFETQGGWAGFSDHYWFTSLIFNRDVKSKVTFSYPKENTFQIDYIGEIINIENNAVASNSIMLFAGAKEIRLIDRYARKFQIEKFDLSIDFGWYYFLTKPFFYILDYLYNLIGNMGWAILVFAALLRLIMFPIASKSYESMGKMKKCQPKIQDIRERYPDDKRKRDQELMELYRKEKINPASGCLPIFIQIPVFFSLYKVLNIAIEIRHAPFIGWIKDLSAPDPLTISVMTGLPIPAMLNIGVWPIVMGITMYIQQKLGPTPANKDQARMFAFMPIIFTFIMGNFASGLVIYWTLSNILSILQQRAIMKKHGVK